MQRFQFVDGAQELLATRGEFGASLVELAAHETAQHHCVEAALLALKCVLSGAYLCQRLTAAGELGRDLMNIVTETLQAEQGGDEKGDAQGATHANQCQNPAANGEIFHDFWINVT